MTAAGNWTSVQNRGKFLAALLGELIKMQYYAENYHINEHSQSGNLPILYSTLSS